MKKTTGLALGGGGTRGLALFSLIESMEKQGVSFDYIAGTSVGGIIGAYYALFGEVTTLRKEILSLSKKDWFGFADFTLANTKSLIKGEKYKEYLQGIFKETTFDDVKIPLIITATNIQTGEIEYINEGKIIDALLASSAYPGILPPHRIGKNLYLDGGVLDNLPYQILFKKKIDQVIAINLGSIQEEETDGFKNSLHIIQRAMDLMINSVFKSTYFEKNSLFLFEVTFKKKFSSLWNVSDLNEKYQEGFDAFEKRKEYFVEWIKKQP